MSLEKTYDPQVIEPRLQSLWQAAGVHDFSPPDGRPVYAIDTPPATISGRLHLGHIYSYTHADLFARFHRMRGEGVFYPMGYDDNGLPTERLVERQTGATAAQIGRRAFVEKCLEISQGAEIEYQALWQRLGLSIDWDYTYRTIDAQAQRLAQWSFLDLLRKGLVYRQLAPTLWCPECRTAIAQAEVDDLERESEFFTLSFLTPEKKTLPIATTRPEMLPACVAVFVHPTDPRYRGFAGESLIVPIFGQLVPILEDHAADPGKGTGAVMCCTFGDVTDKTWWLAYHLPLVEVIGRDGRLTNAAGPFTGLPVNEARRQIVAALERSGLLLSRKPIVQVVPVHERCDTPVEFVMSHQWFIRVLDHLETWLDAGEQVHWHPEHMKARYRSWVENLAWDWCISRQRAFGVPLPLWYCADCGEISLPEESELPVDPLEIQPGKPCPCGGERFIPEADVFDTWMTSSMTPQIAGGFSGVRVSESGDLYRQVFPFTLRPQGHEIIRTWAFYTIVKSQLHFDALPWSDVAISGWGIAGEGMGKISKSRGGGPLPPQEMIERYSADAVRYWAASTALGKDAVISEEKIRLGGKLITKLWNVARFSQPFLRSTPKSPGTLAGTPAPLPLSTTRRGETFPPEFTPADRWILSRAQRLVRRITSLMEDYEYAAAKSETEEFFWGSFTDNYLEMCKQRLYDLDHSQREASLYTLQHVFLTLLKLFAPFLPHVTETIYQELFAGKGLAVGKKEHSIHRSDWPEPDPSLEDVESEEHGDLLVEIATAVRRYKSERGLPLGSELNSLQLATRDAGLENLLQLADADLRSVTRARQVRIVEHLEPSYTLILENEKVQAAINL